MVSATHKAIGSLGAVGVLALLHVLTFGAGVALADEQDDTITSDTYDVE